MRNTNKETETEKCTIPSVINRLEKLGKYGHLEDGSNEIGVMNDGHEEFILIKDLEKVLAWMKNDL